MTEAQAWQDFTGRIPEELCALFDAYRPDTIEVAGDAVNVAEITEILREQLRTQPDAAERALREDCLEPGLLAAAWRQVLFRQCRAVQVLLEAGLDMETRANARVALEHALFQRRLALAAEQDALEPFLQLIARKAYKHQSKVVASLQDIGEADGFSPESVEMIRYVVDAYAQDVMTPNVSGPRLSTVREVFLGAPGGEKLYGIYALLSETVHAGQGSAAPYLIPALSDRRTLLSAPAPLPWAQIFAVLCWSCWAADHALTQFLLDGEDLAPRHEPLLARLGLIAD